VVTEEDLPLPWPYLHVARDPDDQRNAKSKK